MSVLGIFGGRGYTQFDTPATDASSSAASSPNSAIGSISYENARVQLRASAAALIAAFLDLSSETKPVYESSVRSSPAVPASLRGTAARLAPTAGAASRLQTMRAINTQTSTDRRSSSRIGLDLSGPAVSTLRSATLGLDVTSPAAPSSLHSASSLGLDLTSPAAASVLSSAILGLDLTSPNAASTLRSSVGLGIDVTTPQSASRVYSSALGLDLTSPDAASVLRSSATLGLDVATPQSASTITSTAQMNTGSTTSYATSLLEFTGSGQASTGEGTLTGTFTGVNTAAAATSLSVNLTHTTTSLNGLLASNVQFEVRDQADTLLFSFNGSLRSGQAVYLGDDIGLSISFSAGRLTQNQSAATTVAHTPITVDPNATFNNATPTLRPKFDGGALVSAGSFTVNGTSITVNANDTINTVLTRINSSAAGVTATVSGDSVTLTSSANSEDNIVLAGDSSGFLSAVKLSGATTARGNIRDDQQVLSKTTQFSGVTNGAFTVNGVSIAVDRTTDSLSSVMSRINASGAGVTASYDSGLDKLVLTGTSSSEDLIAVAGDTSGFLGAAHLATANTVRGHVSEDTTALSNLAQFASVTNGSFVVDGQTINVATSDTIQSIVSRINALGARVTAAFDSATNTIGLTTTFNSEDDVSVGSDTSGFLSAAGIDAVNSLRGNVRDDDQTLIKSAQFGSVTSGSFTINGVSVAVNRSTDTLNTVISRINGAGAGVTAAYDSGTDRLILTGTADSEDLIAVDDDSTGFVAAAHLATNNTVRGHLPEDGVALANLSAFQAVTDGSFTLDGRTIAVGAATDTVQSIVDKINNSGARVTASYDAGTDRITLEDSFNSEDDVSLGNDTSGFLSAAGLTASSTVRGNLRDDLQVLSKTSQFGAVASGTFDVNGATITVNAATDTLTSVIDKINGAGAGVTATFNASTNKIELLGTTNGEDLVAVGNDGTGFLSVAGLAAENTTRGNIADDQQVLAKTSQFGTVTSGSFTINGRTITIDAATDTLATVVGQINTANAGVTAAYDPLLDRVVLTADTASEEPIAVNGDTTGFLSATGLATSNTSWGNIADDRQVLSKTSQFGGVSDGSFTVNGVSISVDTAQDSLQTVIARINGAGAGVTASYDSTADALVFTPNAAGASLALESDSTGFLEAAHVATGTVGTEFNPDAAFNGVGLDSPMFDPPAFAHAGSFTVNGITINVSNSDTVNSVLAKITASAADVIAMYDLATKTVMIISRHDSSEAIAMGNDTSGFLAAVKLDDAIDSNPGIDAVSAFDTALAGMTEYAGLRSGAITVNGTRIAVDPSTMTVRGLASALNDVAGVSATLDGATGALTLTSTHGASPIHLADTSGLLDTLGIVPGSYAGRGGPGPRVETQTGTATKSNASAVAASIAAAAQNVNEAFAQIGALTGVDAKTRRDMEASIRSVVSAMSVAGVDGLTAHGDRSGLHLTADRGAIERSLISNSSSITDMLGDTSDLGAALGAMLDKFGANASTGRPGVPRRLSRTDLESKLNGELLGNELALRLVLLRSNLRLGVSDVSSRGAAAKAYADSETAFAKFRAS